MKYIFANWKMYLDYDETNILANELSHLSIASSKNVTVGVFPSSLAIADVVRTLKDANIGIGAQNVAWVPKGAYTGAISALMYKDIGVEYALIGHSERRHIFGETNEAIAKKFTAALDVGLIPIVCIGETQEDRAAGKREYRLKKQLMKLFEGVTVAKDTPLIIAYEPVWAIGTGDACDPVEAAEIHQLIKHEAKNYLGSVVPVIYGGSVDEKNVVSYLSLDPVGGVLIGKASTHGDTFSKIVLAAESLS